MADVPNVRRTAARVILLNAGSETLLFEGRDLSDPEDRQRWWFTPGGAVEPTESHAEAAIREVCEETGHHLDRVHGPIARRQTTFSNHGVDTDQVEYFFVARIGAAPVHDRGWTDVERAAVTDWRWWSREELARSGVTYYPENLLDLLDEADDVLAAAHRRP